MKLDEFLEGQTTLTSQEMAGRALFDGKGNCNSSHLDGISTLPTRDQTDTGTDNATQPLFTCFGYANLGLPLDPRVSIYYQNGPDGFGFTLNPDGIRFRDLGMGTFLRSGPGFAPDPNASNWLSLAPTADGQMQTSTMRNAAMTPPQCPTTEPGQFDANGNRIPYFQKEFFHNGYIKSLKQLVHFSNTRDVFAFKRHVGTLPGGNGGKGELLADA